MEKYIKYKRFNDRYTKESLQVFFDLLITEGWEIIYYNEYNQMPDSMHVTVVCGKKQESKI
jgi:hypothetical protein